MAPPITPRTVQEWGAVTPQWIGLAGVVGSAGFWAATGRASGPLIGAFLAMVGVGQGAEAVACVRRALTQAAINQENAEAVGDGKA